MMMGFCRDFFPLNETNKNIFFPWLIGVSVNPGIGPQYDPSYNNWYILLIGQDRAIEICFYILISFSRYQVILPDIR